jgi:hypothetical protein
MNPDGSFKARLRFKDGLWWSTQAGTIGVARGCANTPLAAYTDMRLLYCKMRDELVATVREHNRQPYRKVRA